MSDDATRIAEDRIAAADAAGLPAGMAKRLLGSTAAELKADAEGLAASITTEPETDDRRPTDMNAWIRKQGGR